MIVMAMPSRFCQMFSKLAVLDRCCFETGICTCLIQCNRVKACKHSDIRKNRCIVFSMTVAVRTDILNQCNMEMWPAMTDCLCIFCHLTIKKFICTVVRIVYRVKTAGSYAASTAFTFIIINYGFFVYISNRSTSAFFRTAMAASTEFFIDRRLAACMLLHLSCTASTAHANILECTAESG